MKQKLKLRPIVEIFNLQSTSSSIAHVAKIESPVTPPLSSFNIYTLKAQNSLE